MTEDRNAIGPAVRNERGDVFGRRFWWMRKPISWKRLVFGRGDLRVVGNKTEGWVELHAEESYVNSLRGPMSTPIARKVSLRLDNAQATALRDFLNTVLGGSSREEKTMIGFPMNGFAKEEETP